MKIAQIVSTFIIALAFCAGQSSRGADTPDIVYDNSTDFSQVDYETVNEAGDQVILAGTSRAVTEIQIEYYAGFTPNGDELGRVRFYANTGPFWNGNTDYPTPASPPLFEGTFPLAQGYQTAVITVPSVTVPDTFTWTVQFLGIAQTPTDRAGLLFYGTPTVGASYDDFWELLPTGWGPLARTDVPKNNFSARILAVAGSTSTQPSLTITRVGSNILVTWPSTDPGYALETKADLNATTWTTVSPAPTLNGSRYEVALPMGPANQFFRLRKP